MSIIRSLPADFQQSLKYPKGLEKAFMKALDDANLKFDTSKTLAKVIRYDKKIASTFTRVTPFDGTSAFPFATNVQGAQKPNSEHDLYYAIRLSYSDESLTNAPWVKGLPPDPAIQNGTFSLAINGVAQLVNIPISTFIGQDADVTEMEQGVLLLDSPIWWPGQTTCRCELNFPIAALDDVSLMVEFIGLGLVS